MDQQKFVSPPNLLKVEEPKRIVFDNRPKPIDLSKANPQFDYQEEIKKVSANANKTTLKINEILPSATLQATALIDLDLILLQQARNHIRKNEYWEALEKLDNYLKKQPNHQEALYLKALCLVNADQQMESFNAQIEALNTLSILNDAGIKDLVVNLKNRICAQVYHKFPIVFLIDWSHILDNISCLQRSDPYCPDYYAFKAIILMERQQVFEAYESIETGVRVAGNAVPPLLIGLKQIIEAQILYISLFPAIQLYKKNEFSKARKELFEASDLIKASSEFILFADYLTKLSSGGFLGIFGGKKKISDVKLEGKREECWKLQSLIVRNEIDHAMESIKREDFVSTERILSGALHYAPEYPYLCFLLAGCRFRLFNDAFFSGQLGNLDSALLELRKTDELAKIASQDKGNEVAPQLMEQIAQAIAFIEAIREQLRKRQEEMNRVNSLITEFISIMEKAKKGIGSLEIFEELFSRMKELKKQAKKTKTLISSNDAIKTLSQLNSAIEANLEILQSLSQNIEEQKKDAVVVSDVGSQFTKIMERIKGGIKSEFDIVIVETELKDLKKDLPNYRKKLKTDQSREEFDQLAEIIEKNLIQIKELPKLIKEQLREREVVDTHEEKFAKVAKTLQSGSKFTSRDQLVNFMATVASNRMDADKAKQSVSNREAKDALSNMIAQYDAILSQIQKIL